jgi:LytS/YehU family sensor histidine kinase
LALVIGGHFLILESFYRLPWILALADSLVFNILLAMLLLPVWYAIAYYHSDKNIVLNTILNHSTILVVVLLVWMHLGNWILLGFNYRPYHLFLLKALPLRFVSGTLFYLMVALVYYLLRNYENARKQEQTRNELEQKIREAQIEMLKSQINPHFLFNSLNSINYLTLQDPGAARAMIVKLSDYLRYSIAHSEQWVSLQEELNNVSRYLEIEQVRFGDKLAFRLEYEKELAGYEIPCMILQPLVENALKHGVYQSLGQVHIYLNVIKEPGHLTIRIMNDIDPEAPKSTPGTGLGLANIRERLRLLYDSNQYLKTIREENKFIAELHLPERHSLSPSTKKA